MDKKEEVHYVVHSKTPFWSFLDGYSCQAEDKDHFLRHLGYKYYTKCTMYEINRAYICGDIIINLGKGNTNNSIGLTIKPNVVNRYWGAFGYILEINHGTLVEPVIEKRIFVNDVEAEEWIKSHE